MNDSGSAIAALEFSSGGDEQPITIIRGNSVLFHKIYCEQDTDRLAMAFVMDLRQYGVEPRNCIADNGGVGKAIIDNMEAKGYRGIVRYMNNQSPVFSTEFADKIAEDHWRFKEILRTCPDLQLPDDPVLYKQMKQRRYGMNDHNRVKLEEKRQHRKRCGESPDRLDVIVMLYSQWSPPVATKSNAEYRSKIEERAKQIAGKGVNSPFGWMKPQKSMYQNLEKNHDLYGKFRIF
jgi:hypothetical protein